VIDARAAAAALFLLAGAASAGAGETADVVSLDAMRQEWIQDVMWCGSGNVTIRYQDVTLTCDRVEVDLATLMVRAEGNVSIDQGTTRLACSRAEFDLRRKVGTMIDAEGFFPPNYHFRGAELEKLDESHYRFHRGVFTSCSLDDTAPPWSIAVRDAVVELEGYGHFRGAAINVKGVPVFYLPRLLWPAKTDRAAGLLVPNLGYSSRHGGLLGNALFVPVSRSFDTTLFLDLYTSGFLGIADEMRWTPAENAAGELFVQTMRDPDTDDWEWKLMGRHTQLLPSGWVIKAEAIDYSDIDFFQQFARTFDPNALRSVYSYGTASRSWGPHWVNSKVDHRETFFGESSSASSVVLERLPTLEYRLRSTRITKFPLYLSLVSSADHFRVDRSETLKGDYSRLDVFPSVALLTSGLSWLNVTPSAGFRYTYYSSRYDDTRTSFEDEPLTRRYAIAGLSIVGPSFSRVWTGASRKVKHLVEPRLEYAFVSDPGDSESVPVFDEKDSVVVTNRARYTLANRLFMKRGAGSSREVATFEISQDYSFSDPLIAARPDLGLPASRYGPLLLGLRLSPAPTINVDARTYLDTQTGNMSSTSLSGYAAIGTNTLGLTWYSSFNPADGDTLSSQTRVFAGITPGNGPLRLETQLAYDLHQTKLLEQRYLLRFRGSCWSAYVELRDYRIEPYKARDYRIAIDLTGLGTFLDIRGSLDALTGP
jgi:LPS-assembly protein